MSPTCTDVACEGGAAMEEGGRGPPEKQEAPPARRPRLQGVGRNQARGPAGRAPREYRLLKAMQARRAKERAKEDTRTPKWMERTCS